MTNPGTTVYVHWYGKLLQGTVVNNHDLMGMVAVRIPLMGGHPVALFTPAHVYASAEEAQQSASTLHQSTTPAASVDGSPVCCRTTATSPSTAWQAIQHFKQEHWDAAHNHLRVDALEGYYQLWRAAIAAKNGFTIAPAEVPTVSVDLGSPDGDKSGIIIIDTDTGEILPELPPEVEHHPIVSEERYQELKQKMPAKLTKKQLRSTGRIHYTDSIQPSIFA